MKKYTVEIEYDDVSEDWYLQCNDIGFEGNDDNLGNLFFQLKLHLLSDSGAVDFVQKPLTKEEIAERIARSMKRTEEV